MSGKDVLGADTCSVEARGEVPPESGSFGPLRRQNYDLPIIEPTKAVASDRLPGSWGSTGLVSGRVSERVLKCFIDANQLGKYLINI